MRLAFFIFITSLSLNAKILDKIVAVIDDELITLSEVNHIKKSYTARKNIAPLIFDSEKGNTKNILNSIIKTYMIRKKLSELGIVVDDETVDSRVSQIEKSQNVTRNFLVNYLKSQGLEFEDYFQLIKNMIEISYFNQKVISPLVSVSDQEVKNFYSGKIAGKVNSFKYKVIDFNISESSLKNVSDAELLTLLSEYKESGNKPDKISAIESSELEFESSSLTPQISKTLSNVKNKNFSKPITINGTKHIFYMLNKKTINNFKLSKNKSVVKNQLLMTKSKETLDKWINNERSNYYIKYF